MPTAHKWWSSSSSSQTSVCAKAAVCREFLPPFRSLVRFFLLVVTAFAGDQVRRGSPKAASHKCGRAHQRSPCRRRLRPGDSQSCEPRARFEGAVPATKFCWRSPCWCVRHFWMQRFRSLRETNEWVDPENRYLATSAHAPLAKRTESRQARAREVVISRPRRFATTREVRMAVWAATTPRIEHKDSKIWGDLSAVAHPLAWCHLCPAIVDRPAPNWRCLCLLNCSETTCRLNTEALRVDVHPCERLCFNGGLNPTVLHEEAGC